MKRTIGFLYTMLIAAVMLASCSGKNAVLPSEITLQVGDRFSYRFTKVLECDVEAATPYTMFSEKTMEVAFVVREINSEGNYVLDALVKRITLENRTSEGDLSYDSSNAPKNTLFPINDISTVSPITLIMAKNGDITDGGFPDDFYEQIQKHYPNYDRITLSGLFQYLQGLEADKFITQTNWFTRPGKDIELGGGWNSTLHRNLILDAEAVMEISNKFTGKSNGKFVVVAEAAIETERIDDGVQNVFSYYNLTGDYNGTFLINPKNGLIQNGSMDARVEGTIEIPTLLEGQGMVTVNMDVKNKIEKLK